MAGGKAWSKLSRAEKEARFLKKLYVCHETGCWYWLGAKSGANQPHMATDKKWRSAASVGIELFDPERGRCPTGREICHNFPGNCVHGGHHCVNPAHNRYDTRAANIADEVRGRLLKTHCRAGHELKPETIYRDSRGRRICKECRRLFDRRRYVSKPRPLKPPRPPRAVKAPKPKIGKGGRHRMKTHCPSGHPYDEANTYWHPGHRLCKTCLREGQIRRREAGYVAPHRRKAEAAE